MVGVLGVGSRAAREEAEKVDWTEWLKSLGVTGSQ